MVDHIHQASSQPIPERYFTLPGVNRPLISREISQRTGERGFQFPPAFEGLYSPGKM